MAELALEGVTWGHTRGYVPMAATAQRFGELHPGVRIEWRARSLQAFTDGSIAALSAGCDLLVIDHPAIGEAEVRGLLLPLDEHLDAAFLQEQAEGSVGRSHASYHYLGRQWALAIDAAAPVAAVRPDLLARHGLREPQHWDELLELARAGLVAFAGLPFDVLMHWYALCINEGQAPFEGRPGTLVDEEIGLPALEAVRKLADRCGAACLARSPIATYELMTSTDRWAYSPLGCGYANYARADYGIPGERLLRFGEPPTRKGRLLRTTLGGAGLAISARCQGWKREAALAYLRYVADPATQSGLYVAMGGQPGHRGAWEDEASNRLTGNFFRNTLPLHERAWLRPRYPGAIAFQAAATAVLHGFLHHGLNAREALAALRTLDGALRPEESAL